MKVDILITSTAVRAFTTAEYFARELGLTKRDLVIEPRIYEASVRTILEVIGGFPPSVESALVFGHNPGFSNLIDHLTGESLGNLPTCGIARINFHIDDWKAVTKGLGQLAWLDYPKQHEIS